MSSHSKNKIESINQIFNEKNKDVAMQNERCRFTPQGERIKSYLLESTLLLWSSFSINKIYLIVTIE